MSYNPTVFPVIILSIDDDSLADFKAGAINQWYYGGLDARSGVIYLVPSGDRTTGRLATPINKFKSNAVMVGLHGNHINDMETAFGAGHLNGLLSNGYFGRNILLLKSHCAAFSIRKKSLNTFEFLGNSTINAMGTFTNYTNRALPPTWHARIAADLATLISQGAQKGCVIL